MSMFVKKTDSTNDEKPPNPLSKLHKKLVRHTEEGCPIATFTIKLHRELYNTRNEGITIDSSQDKKASRYTTCTQNKSSQ